MEYMSTPTLNPLAAMRSIDPIMAETGYTPKTTFWQDFSIADCYGVKAVKDTYRRAFNGWKHDRVYLTELVMVLNHKIWQHHDNGRQQLALCYNELWKAADAWGLENLKGEDLSYFLHTLD